VFITTFPLRYCGRRNICQKIVNSAGHEYLGRHLQQRCLFMRTYRIILLLVAGVLGLYGYYHSDSATGTAQSQPRWTEANGEVGRDNVDSVPKKALQVLEIVRRTGLPPEGYVGGRVFQNREHRLPADGEYREFDVDPHRGGRNAERIIVEWQTKKAWYTSDHYQTFIPLP